jgi:hypothetical protein
VGDSPHDEGPGSERKINRRDFLDGVAISAAGLAAAAASPSLTGAEAALIGSRRLPRDYYPPTDTGIVGEPDGVIRDVMRIDGRPNPRHPHSTEAGPGIHPRRVRDVDDCYDLVVVGAGASGLAAAKWYQDRFEPDSKILLVDPLPDFGGHSHRNEFHIHDATSGGGDAAAQRRHREPRFGRQLEQAANGLLDIPGSYGQPALDMLAFCGVTPDEESFPENINSRIPADYGLRQMLLFPKQDWGTDTLVRAMSFRDFQRAIIDVIDRSVNKSGGDFEPERDIESIIVNRWNYGYAYELTSTFDPSLYGPNAQKPHVTSRKPYRNVAIANSDSGAFAYTHSAINEAYRAVQELPSPSRHEC